MIINPEFQQELIERYSPEGSPLRKAQHRMVELLLFLDRICKEHGLQYWLDGGTLLGAMRHGGFIPWDDDTDVCMTRRDALKLKEIMGNKVFDGHIVLQTHDTDPGYYNSSWFVLRDINSEYIQNSRDHRGRRFRGVQVDIFLMEQGNSKMAKRLSTLAQWWLVSKPRVTDGFLRHFQPLTRPMWGILNTFVFPTMRLFKKRNNGNWNFALGVGFTTDVPDSKLLPTTTVEFEGHTFSAPADVEFYLGKEYGDWREVPDENHRVTHQAEIIFYDETPDRIPED